MERIKRIILLSLIIFTCFGCQDISDIFTDSSSSNTKAIIALNRAQQIQEIYWKCIEDPANINSNKVIWANIYPTDIIDAGISLYNETLLKDSENISGVSITDWTPQEKEALLKAIQKIKEQKE